jgi:hypothetical protein
MVEVNSDMEELILHHYDFSPFSQKIRLIFGIKDLSWRSVTIPSILPKPDLVALTGGYRHMPVMQIGADVYCDTRLIADELDRRFPDRPCCVRSRAGSRSRSKPGPRETFSGRSRDTSLGRTPKQSIRACMSIGRRCVASARQPSNASRR